MNQSIKTFSIINLDFFYYFHYLIGYLVDLHHDGGRRLIPRRTIGIEPMRSHQTFVALNIPLSKGTAFFMTCD